MTMSSIGSNAYFNYGGYQSTGLYGNNDSSFTLNQNQNQVQGAGKQQGGPPPPPPGGGRGGRMEGPDLDTDSDGLWSSDEIDDFASTMGIDIDTENILSTYDTDGDGSINSDERVALGKDNAFNLPSPKDMMNQMRGFSPPPNIQQSQRTSATATVKATDEDTNSQAIQQLLEAYSQQNMNWYQQMLNPSFDREL